MAEFANRPGNKAEIQAKRDGVAAELSWRWSTNREKKYAELETEVEEVEGEVDDPSLTPADRLRARNLKRQLIRDMNEMTGHLVTRSRVEVDTGPALTSEIVGFDPAEWMAGLVESRRDPGPDSAPAAAAADEPEPEPGEDANVRPFRAFGSSDSINTRLQSGNRPAPTPDSSPPEVKAARELAIMIWNSQLTPLSHLRLSVDDPALDIAKALGWLVMAADDAAVMRGQVDPRPPTVTAIPNF